MVRRDLLIGILKDQGRTYIGVSKALNMTPKTLYNKLRGNRSFTIEEATRMIDFLGIKRDEILDIFFAQ